jgi:hypothetical protein
MLAIRAISSLRTTPNPRASYLQAQTWDLTPNLRLNVSGWKVVSEPSVSDMEHVG